MRGGVPLSECVDKLDLRPEHWIADLDMPPGFMVADPAPDWGWIKEAELVIVVVYENEVSHRLRQGTSGRLGHPDRRSRR